MAATHRKYLHLIHSPSPALVVTCLTAAILLLLLSLRVRNHHVSILERDVFIIVNHLPGWLHPILFTVMQAGSYVAVFATATLAAAFKRTRLALELLLVGNIAYWLAVLCKGFVHRQRPHELLTQVELRDVVSGIFGYPSGHTAVATALGLTAARYIPKRFHILIWIGIIAVGFARVYVGAHLPVDVLGGFLVGWLSSNLAQLLLGEHPAAESTSYVRKTLQHKGIQLQDLQKMSGDARGSVPYHGTANNGQRLFIKVGSNRQRDADWLYKSYRKLLYRQTEDEPPFISAKQASEHEAYMSLLAERAKVNTPSLITSLTDSEGNTYLVYYFTPGETLNTLSPKTIRDVLTNTWRQVLQLHKAGMAHRDLRGSNILIHNNNAYLVDLSFAKSDASRKQQLRDVATLLITIAIATDTASSVAAAKSVMGKDTLIASLPHIQKGLLPTALRKQLRSHPTLIEKTRTEIAHQCNVTPQKPESVLRISRRALIWVTLLGLAVHFLLPQVGEVRLALHHLLSANPLWILASLVASTITYLLSALVFISAAVKSLPFRQVVLLQTANSFANRLAPGSIGGIALNIRFLQKQGMDAAASATAITLARIAGFIASIALLPLLLLFVRNAHLHTHHHFKESVILLVFTGLLVVIGIILAFPKLRRQGHGIAQKIAINLRLFIHARKALPLLAFSFALTAAYAICLYLSLLAVHAHPNIIQILLVYIAGSSLGSVAPTPGGIGATEAALVSALTLFNTPLEQAIAGVLIFRLVSFWLPMVVGFFALQQLARAHQI